MDTIPHVDVLLVTVTEVEAQAVFDAFTPGQDKQRRFIGDNTYYDLGVHGGARVFMVQSEMGSGGLAGSQATVQASIEALHPDSVVMVGIAFGVNSQNKKIGDILVSRQLMSYEPQRVGTDRAGQQTRIPRGSRAHASVRLVDRFVSGKKDWDGQEVHIGLILSGEKLVDNLEFRRQLLELEPEAIGGEMEGAGLYAAAERARVDWILVKAICDWADGHKSRGKRQRQQLAAQNAARFVLHVVRQGGLVGGKSIPTAPPLTAAPTLSSLHQLPPPPRDFTGREDEMTELLAALERGGVTISGLRGMGGIGKTALALKLAEQLTPRYRDAQFFLDLKGTTMPLSPAEAMAHVIRGYHPTARLPETEAELRGLYCSVLSGQRALLLMDNARDAAQVEPLIPPASCLLLVTSRWHFHLPGLFARNLDTLPAADARKLLLTIAPRIDGRAAEIAQLCGCLPLALTLAGRALAERESLSVDDYVRRLQDARKRLEFVEASLALSYDLLTSELQRRWCMLVVFPATFEQAGAAAVWQVEPDAAQDALDELVRYSLVDFLPSPVPAGDGGGAGGGGRYRLHDLARLFADTRLSAPDRADAGQRHAAHYADVIGVANQLYLQGGESLRAGLALFDLEWPNIQAGQAWAAARSTLPPLSETGEGWGEGDTVAQLCSDYPDAGTYCLNLRLHPREWINWLEAALSAARKLKDRQAEGNSLGNLGAAYAALGEARRAIEFYQQQLVVTREIGDRRGEGNALGNLGNAYAALGEARRAIEFYEQALKIEIEIGDRRAEGNALGNLGIAYKNLGEARRAIEFYEKQLVIVREIGDRRGEGAALGNLGNAYADLGEARRAIEFYEQALKIEIEIGDRRAEGNALGNLGIAYADLGDARRAIEFYEQQLAIVREIGDRRGEGNASWNLGLVYEEQGDLARAAALMQVCVDYEREIGHQDAEKDAAQVEAIRVRMTH